MFTVNLSQWVNRCLIEQPTSDKANNTTFKYDFKLFYTDNMLSKELNTNKQSLMASETPHTDWDTNQPWQAQNLI